MVNRTTSNEVTEAIAAVTPHGNGQPPSQSSTTSPAPANISNLVARYQTTIGIHSLLDSSSHDTLAHETRPNSTGNTETASEDIPRDNLTEQQELRATSAGPQETFSKFIKGFQPAFDSNDPLNSQAKQRTSKQAKFTRTSISSLINSDENAPLGTASKSGAQSEKRKRASPKTEAAVKKTKVDTQKKTAKTEVKKDTKSESLTEPKSESKQKADPKKDTKPEAKRASKQDSKTETKKSTKAKKKSPELILPSQDKPSIHPTMTTEKAKTSTSAASVPAPSFIPMDDSGTAELGLGTNDDKDKQQFPVIALEIPLLDPKSPMPGQAEVVVNVLKLAEEKYGWSAVHPEARSAFELMDDVLDDEEDGDEEEDEEVMIVDEKGNSLKKKDDGSDKKKKKQPPKVNRKVGKYDYEDPFIDDAELQWEEEITTTKEGFFVYWGPLVDERQPAKKGTGKAKK